MNAFKSVLPQGPGRWADSLFIRSKLPANHQSNIKPQKVLRALLGFGDLHEPWPFGTFFPLYIYRNVFIALVSSCFLDLYPDAILFREFERH